MHIRRGLKHGVEIVKTSVTMKAVNENSGTKLISLHRMHMQTRQETMSRWFIQT